MNVAQPRGQVVQPALDHGFEEGADFLIYRAKTHSKVKLAVFLLSSIPLLVVGIFAFLFGLVGWGEGGGSLILLAIACVSVCLLFAAWAGKPTAYPVVFDAKSIAVKDETYMLERVTSLGRAPGSGQIYIVCDAMRIPVISGLRPSQAENVHSTISRFLARFGWRFD